MVNTSKLTMEQSDFISKEMKFLIDCVRDKIITVDEYIEQSDLYLYPLIKQMKK